MDDPLHQLPRFVAGPFVHGVSVNVEHIEEALSPLLGHGLGHFEGNLLRHCKLPSAVVVALYTSVYCLQITQLQPPKYGTTKPFTNNALPTRALYRAY